MAGQARAHPVPRETTTEGDHKLMIKASQNQGLGSIALEKGLRVRVGMEHVML